MSRITRLTPIGAAAVDKNTLGLTNVDNTHDVDKPVSSATQTALNLKQALASKGQPNGYAPLGSNGLVPGSYLPVTTGGTTVTQGPSFVDFGMQQAELALGPSFASGYDSTVVTKIVTGIKAVGAKRVRIAIPWSYFEPSKGTYDPTYFGYLDAALNTCAAKGVLPLLTFTYPVAGYSPTTTDFANFCRFVAARYGAQGTAQVREYEMWNEPNLSASALPGSFTGANYTAWMIAGADAIRGADSGAFIITGGTGAATTVAGVQVDPVDWITAIYDNNGQSHFDAIGYHYYSTDGVNGTVLEPTDTQTFYTKMLAVRALMVARGDSAKPVWVTEFGFPVPQVSLATAANYLAKQVNQMTKLSWIQSFIILGYQNATDNPPYGIVSTDLTQKLQPLYDTVLSINATATVPPSGSADPRIVMSTSRIGDARDAGLTYTYTHNLGTKSLWPVLKDIQTNEMILAKMITNTANTLLITPDVSWPLNSKRITLFGLLGLVDETPPSAPPALAYVSTLSKKITVAVSGGTDNVAVTGYNFFYDTGGAKTYAGNLTAAGNFDYNLPASGTSYNLTATAYDAEGNESTSSNVLVRSTATSPAPVFDAAGTDNGGIGTATGNQAVWSAVQTIVIGNGSNRILLAFVGHNGNGGTVPEANATITVTSNKGIDGSTAAPLTKLKGIDAGDGASNTVGIGQVWYLLNPAPGTHTITSNVNTGGSWSGNPRLAATSWSNVSSVALKTFRTGIGTSAVVNAAMTSAVDNVAGIAIFQDNAAPTGFNGTTRVVGGANVSGQADFLLVGDLPGAANVTFTTTSVQSNGYITFDLVKA